MKKKPANPGNRTERGYFKKGQSGNPSGRPPVPDAFKQHVHEAEAKILELMNSDDENIALKAASLVLAYVKGKPAEHHEHSGTLTLEQLLSGTWEENG